ncbi:MAG: hypothetical protein K1X57_02720 [Gemmataceae bacterium]|nr:hypothetical protein [Gemmataceae bacterium]
MRFSVLLLLPLILAADPAPVDCGPDAMRLFGTKVQPFLFNACVACHAGEKPGNFSLRRGAPGRSLPPETGQTNLAASLRQIDRAAPEKSPLLVKSLTAHGGQTRPSLKDTTAPAYRNLHEWARMVAAEGKAPPSDGKTKDQPSPASGKSDDPHDPAGFNRGS